MKILVGVDTGTYTFSPSTKQITLTGIKSGSSTVTLTLEQIILITNVTDNVILYNFADATLGASVTSNIITLNYDTVAMSSTDRLMIILDIPDPMSDILSVLKRLVKLNEPVGNVDIANRQRVSVDYSPNLTVATLTTITNPVPVGNIATVGGLNPAYNYRDTSRIAYQNCIRNKLTWS